MCIGYYESQNREDRIYRDLIYYNIKGWADPKKFTVSKNKFWPLFGDEEQVFIMPSIEDLRKFDQMFRGLGRGKNGKDTN